MAFFCPWFFFGSEGWRREDSSFLEKLQVRSVPAHQHHTHASASSSARLPAPLFVFQSVTNSVISKPNHSTHHNQITLSIHYFSLRLVWPKVHLISVCFFCFSRSSLFHSPPGKIVVSLLGSGAHLQLSTNKAGFFYHTVCLLLPCRLSISNFGFLVFNFILMLFALSPSFKPHTAFYFPPHFFPGGDSIFFLAKKKKLCDVCAFHIIPQSSHQATWADMNGDGRLDILTARASKPVVSSPRAEMVWLEQPEDPTQVCSRGGIPGSPHHGFSSIGGVLTYFLVFFIHHTFQTQTV